MPSSGPVKISSVFPMSGEAELLEEGVGGRKGDTQQREAEQETVPVKGYYLCAH